MNIYATDACPQTNARNLDNKLLKEQILQVGILLSILSHKWGQHINNLYLLGDANSGYVRWLENDSANVDWLMEYGICLLVEYGNRFEASHQGRWCIVDFIELWGEPCGLYPLDFPNNTVDNTGFDFTYMKPVFVAYREYLISKWGTARYTPMWGNRLPPYWYMERIENIDLT